MSQTVQETVRSSYGKVASSGLSNDHDGVRAVVEAFGYTSDELASVPAGANMGLSCGNPIAFASLRAGEVVVDLGCGGGLDVFLAAEKVGADGNAIGIDMTPEMIERATRNATKGRDGKPYSNVEFHLANIDKLPLATGSADVVISNCVINLAQDKAAVIREIFRVLKPGGRVAVSDIALKKPLPDDLARDIMAYVGCVSGAVLIEDYKKHLLNAGFAHVVVNDTGSDLNAYAKVEGQAACCAPSMNSATETVASSSCCGGNSCSSDAPDLHTGLAGVLERYNVNEYAASVRVYAVKPK
jgi:ubiquinone/menaquinone biosynthesis C-methylase UbiE